MRFEELLRLCGMVMNWGETFMGNDMVLPCYWEDGLLLAYRGLAPADQ